MLLTRIWNISVSFRLGWSFFWTYLKLFSKFYLNKIFSLKIGKEKIFGYTIFFSSYDSFILLYEDIFHHRAYDIDLKSSAPLIFDLGGNIGMSVIFFKLKYPKSNIFVFEAGSKTFELLKKNINFNKLHGVTAINKAVSGKKGRIKFYYDSSCVGSGLASIKEGRVDSEFEEVDSDILSNYINKKIDLLKIDIEGAETEVINEIYRAGKLKMFNNIICEYHHHINDKENELGIFLNKFEKTGFNYQISSFLRPPYKKGVFQNIDIYFYK